eukprot:7448082-Alexandrium_andersonii.AAC.1
MTLSWASLLLSLCAALLLLLSLNPGIMFDVGGRMCVRAIVRHAAGLSLVAVRCVVSTRAFRISCMRLRLEIRRARLRPLRRRRNSRVMRCLCRRCRRLI